MGMHGAARGPMSCRRRTQCCRMVPDKCQKPAPITGGFLGKGPAWFRSSTKS